MTFAEAKFAGVAFAVLSLTVAINLFAIQERRPTETAALNAIKPVMTAPAATEPSSLATAAIGAASAAAPAAEIQPVATPGVSQAEIIRGVQRELTSRGYGAGQPDGIAGLVTRAAIMAYEHDYGLALTGEASEDLLNRIVLGSSGAAEFNRSAPDVILSAEAKAVVRFVTQGLSQQGYKPGNDGGTLSAETRRAIVEFEAAQKLPSTGRISAPLVSRMLKLQAQTPQVQTPQAVAGRGRTAQK